MFLMEHIGFKLAVAKSLRASKERDPWYSWRSSGSPHLSVGNPCTPLALQRTSLLGAVQSTSAISWVAEEANSSISLSQSGLRALQCPHCYWLLWVLFVYCFVCGDRSLDMVMI